MVTPEVAITYGHLIQVILQFIIVALTIFLVIRHGHQTAQEAGSSRPPAAKPDDVALLEEIRDLLKTADLDSRTDLS